jgi:hypothetical protein
MAKIIGEGYDASIDLSQKKTVDFDWSVGLPVQEKIKYIKVGIGGTRGKRSKKLYCGKYAVIKEIALTPEEEELRRQKNINVGWIVRMALHAKKVTFEY